MSIEIKGIVTEIGETQTLGQKGFQKRAFVVKTDEKYPQELEIEATKDRIQDVDGLRIGDEVSVAVNLRGRRWEGPKGVKFFVSLEAWKIEMVGVPRRTGGGPTADKPIIDVPAHDPDGIPFGSCSITHEPSPISRLFR